MRQDPVSIAENMDCMEFMARYPDKYFELAIVDPPYGIGDKKLTSGGTWANKYKKGDCSWDINLDESYFSELFRVSKNWIIWGGNYYSDKIPGNRCFIVWRKLQMLGMHTMADCELALTSLDKNAKIFDGNNSQDRIPPTQKPVALYKWLLNNYAKSGDKILDTHLGSGSSRIAAYDLGFDFYSCELDKDYFQAQEKRFQEFANQQRMF
jgi:site-specific DNA-methyltransferase (adenine-specific)